VVGNKIDLKSSKERWESFVNEVKSEEEKRYKKNKKVMPKIEFIDVSAKRGTNIEAFKLHLWDFIQKIKS
jgi:GTPase SAR1 family protein